MTITYVIFRRGSNACNQPGSDREPVAVLDGDGVTSRERMVNAIQKAHALPDSVAGCYNNQYLQARPWAQTGKDDRQMAQEWMETRSC